MSFVEDLLFGSEGQAPTVEDVRTPLNRAVGQQSQEALSGLIQQGTENVVGGFQGPMAVPMGQREGNLLRGIQEFATGPHPSLQAARGQITRQASGAGALSPLVTQAGPEAVGMAQNVLSGQTADPTQNQVLQRSIEAAQRPLVEQFGQQMGDLRGEFTQAGQFVQPGASSPFETAAGRLQTGLAGAMGDVSTDLVSQNLQQERQRQLDLTNMLSQAFESGQTRALQASEAAAPMAQRQIQGLTQALEAQALPRMIQERGLERGINEFNQQRQQFMNALLGSFRGVGSPMAVQMPGQEGGGGLLQPMLTAAGTAMGGPLGGAAGNALGGGLTDTLRGDPTPSSELLAGGGTRVPGTGAVPGT